MQPRYRAHRGGPARRSRALLPYAGVPLTNTFGKTIGALCGWDSRPRQWTSGHVQTLHDLAALVRRRVFGTDE